MSKHNRDRRAWKCAVCKEPMWRETGQDVQRKLDKQIKEAGIKRRLQLVHLCGKCKTLHLEENGGLRKMTPAEEFDLRMRQPKTAEAMDAMGPIYGKAGTATLIFPMG